jgi:signal transduction histidine kinase
MATLVETLTQAGYEVAGFTAGADALTALRAHPFDVLLTDLLMPGMDGIALLKAGLEADPNLVGVIMTGQGTLQTAVEAMQVGALDYLLKPFTLQAALPLLERALQMRRLRVQNAHLREMTLAITADLSFADTLKRIVVAAADLAEARYAALGVPDETGELLVEFIYTGLAPEDAARIGHLPRGHGILGVIMREGKSLRLRDLEEHPRSAGFPPNHPPMTSFLGVPIIAKGRSVGNLYLTDKLGAAEFTEADQAIIELLAAHAASAITNARLYQSTLDHSRELEERNRQLAALNAVAAAINQYLDLNQVMAESLEQVLAVSNAEVGQIYLLHEGSGDMVLALHRGPFAEAFQAVRRFRRGEGFPGQVALTGQPRVSSHLAQELGVVRTQIVEAGFRAYACLPLFAKSRVVGTLDLASRDPSIFDRDNLALLTSIGHQIGVAVENAQLYRQVAQLAVLEERQRIGMDLHDGVIQSIYAVGLTLEYINAQLVDGDVAGASDRLKTAMDALNATIRDIRAYILDLRPRRFEGDDLIAGLNRLLAEFRANTLMTVDFAADPEADRWLTPDARLALFHIAQEALSNAAKHSRASRMEVRLLDHGKEISLSLRDNGLGFKPEQVERRVGHGLSNMQDRAAALGGELRIYNPNGQGAEVCVRLPKR